MAHRVERQLRKHHREQSEPDQRDPDDPHHSDDSLPHRHFEPIQSELGKPSIGGRKIKEHADEACQRQKRQRILDFLARATHAKARGKAHERSDSHRGKPQTRTEPTPILKL